MKIEILYTLYKYVILWINFLLLHVLHHITVANCHMMEQCQHIVHTLQYFPVHAVI